MIIEHNWSLSEAQQVTASGATLSTNVIDLSDGRDLGRGRPLYLHFYVDETPGNAAAAATASLDIAVVTANNEALTSFPVDVARATAKVVVAAPGGQPVTNATADWHLWERSQFYLPLGSPDVGILGTPYSQGIDGGAGASYSEFLGHRYLGVRYTWTFGVGGAVSAFKVSSRLVLDQSTLPPIYPASTNT